MSDHRNSGLLLVEKSLLLAQVLALGVDELHEELTAEYVIADLRIDDALPCVDQIVQKV